jgi:hypothetical protein
VTTLCLTGFAPKAVSFSSESTYSICYVVEPSNVDGDGDNHETGEVDCTNNFDKAIGCLSENPLNRKV